MTTYITVQGCEEPLREKIRDTDKIIVLKPYQPIYTQIAFLPNEEDVVACPPADWDKEAKEEFAHRVSEAVLSLMVSRSTIDHFQEIWERNAIQNYELIKKALPIDKIPPFTDKAIIYGNGPSLDPSLQDGIIFATWHSVGKIKKAHFVVHVDAEQPQEGGRVIEMPSFKPEYGIIGTPTTAPEFFQAFPCSPIFSYFSSGCNLDIYMAEKLNHAGHPAVSCTVVDMIMNACIVMGFNEIHLTGFDLSHPTEEAARKYDTKRHTYPQEGVGGKTVWTDCGWQKQQTCTEGLIARYPDIKFVNHSKGLRIKGMIETE